MPTATKARVMQFEGIAYTGVPVKVDNDRLIIDLSGIQFRRQQMPVFRQYDPEQILGHTQRVKVTTAGRQKGIEIAGVLSGEDEHVSGVAVPARNGFQWQLALIGVSSRATLLQADDEATVNDVKVTGPMYIVRAFDLVAFSIVSLGADGKTSVAIY
jgi:hypothetical protein